MDWQLTRHILQGVLACGVMLLALASILAVWRLRGILHWKRSLSDELKDLDVEAEAADECKAQALTIVRDRCQGIWRAPSPELKELTDLSAYVRSIAACYHPGLERPELHVTIGSFLKSARDSVDRLGLILRRPGFQRLRGVRIRHIRQTYEWYGLVSRCRIVRSVSRYRKLVARIFQLHLAILPDPFSWLAYLSNRLTILTLTRCLLADVYLFVGRLAVQAYQGEEKGEPLPSELGELEKTLEDLDSLAHSGPHITDSQILDIRNHLVGFPSMLISSPSLEDWKAAVGRAAKVIAKKYFPDAEQPLEEAALGPLLTRSQAWIRSLYRTERISAVKRFHRIQLQSLYRVKSLADMCLPRQVRTLVKKTWDMYRWMKWPLMVYRGVKKSSSVGIAMDVGWMVSKRAFINFACRYTFDMACQELDMIYSQSRAKEASPVCKIDEGIS